MLKTNYLVLNIRLNSYNLDTKIEAFHDCIKKLQKSRSLKFYFEVKESYDKIIVSVSEVFKMISNILHESKIDKLIKRIDEDLEIIHKKDGKVEEESKVDSKEKIKEELTEEINREPKEEIKEKNDFLKLPDIFGKKISIMVADYLSAKKIKQLQDNIQKVCKCKK